MEVGGLRRYHDIKLHKVSNILLLSAVLLGILTFIVCKQLNQHISELCEYKSKERANKIITDVIDNKLKGSRLEFLNIVRDENSNIISIETNTNEINRVQNELRESINDKLSDLEHDTISIPLGTLSGIVLFSGRGRELSVRLHQAGVADSEIKSEFESAGINQTKHRVILTISIEMSAILPTKSTNITITNDYLISETIIVGNIPSALLTNNK